MPRSPSRSPSSSPSRSRSPERSHLAARRRVGGGGASASAPRRRSPSPPPRRSLRPRRAAAPSSRPLVDDFFPFPSSPSPSPPRPQHRRPSPEPSSSDSDGGGGGAGAGAGSSASDRRRRKLKLVVKLSQLPPDQHQRRGPPPPPYSDDSDGDEEAAGNGCGGEERVKPPKKRRIEPRGDRSRHHEVAGGRNDAASAPRTKRLPVPGTTRTTPLPDRKALEMILEKLQKKDSYGVFAEPVDPEELPDYHDVIEHPMDFGTVRRKLARNAYRSFEQFEDDVFLICSNAMQYNAPDTIYFRQAHSIQELARKKFQELRDEGIPSESQVKNEHKVKPNSCNREPVKKPVLRCSDNDRGFLSRKEQVKRLNSKNSEDDVSFKDQIKKSISRNSEDGLSSSFHKEKVKKSFFSNSESGLGSSFHREHAKKPISRNSEDDLSSSLQKEQVRKTIVRNSENDRISFHKQKVKKPTSRTSKDDLSSQKKHIRSPIFRNGEDLDFSSYNKAVDNPNRTNGEDVGSLSQKRLVEKPICRNGDDICHSRQKESPGHFRQKESPGHSSQEESPSHLLRKESPGYSRQNESPGHFRQNESPGHFRQNESPDHSHQNESPGHSRQNESPNQPNFGDGQDDLGYSCNEETVKRPFCLNNQDALGSDVSAATIASAGDGSNGLSISQTNASEPPGCTVASGFLDKDTCSPLDEIRSEKNDDISAKDYSAKASYKSMVVDETRRKTYDISDEQPPSKSDPIFNVFYTEPKELISVGLHTDHAYARSLARFASSLGAQGWRIASERIQQVLPNEVKFGRGWVGEYEPLLPPILVVQGQSRSLTSSAANVQRNASLPIDIERLRTTETINSKDMSLGLLNRITTGNNVVGVSGPLESSEFKPRLFGVSAEVQHRNTDALSRHENNRLAGSATKTKRIANEQTRKGNSSSSARPLEIQPQKSECSKGVSSRMVDMPALNNMAGQPRPFFQPPEVVRTHQTKKGDTSKSTHPLEMAPQRVENAKGTSGVHNVPSQNNTNGQPKPFFQSQEVAVPQPRNEATWVYHGRPGDGKFGTSEKTRPTSRTGFITKNQPVNVTNFTMNANGQRNISDHENFMGSNAIHGQMNMTNRGLDVPRNIFPAFPATVRENQSISSAPVAQSWISFGAASESKPTIVSPTFHDNNSCWKMPFANARPSDEQKLNAVPQFFRQPVQMRENPVQNKSLVIFPQLVQTDFSRSQGQQQWQGFVPHMQQKSNKDVLRPDLNIGFPSPGSPPARQSSGINLEAQQPDLALQL